MRLGCHERAVGRGQRATRSKCACGPSECAAVLAREICARIPCCGGTNVRSCPGAHYSFYLICNFARKVRAVYAHRREKDNCTHSRKRTNVQSRKRTYAHTLFPGGVKKHKHKKKEGEFWLPPPLSPNSRGVWLTPTLSGFTHCGARVGSQRGGRRQREAERGRERQKVYKEVKEAGGWRLEASAAIICTMGSRAHYLSIYLIQTGETDPSVRCQGVPNETLCHGQHSTLYKSSHLYYYALYVLPPFFGINLGVLSFVLDHLGVLSHVVVQLGVLSYFLFFQLGVLSYVVVQLDILFIYLFMVRCVIFA